MRFTVQEVKDAGSVSRQADLDPAVLIGTPPDFIAFKDSLKTQLKAQMTQGEIVVTGKVKTTLNLKCARCLESFDRPYEIRLAEVFGLDQEEFDVTGEIREAVLIDLPYKALCRESCKGLCATCGKNRNQPGCNCEQKPSEGKAEDLRWGALKKFPFR